MWGVTVKWVCVMCVWVKCVYMSVCVCEGYPAQGIDWIVSTCVLMQTSGRVWSTREERGCYTWWLLGGVRFHSTMQHIWAVRAELDFPRLKTHSLHTLTCVCKHPDKTWSTHKHLRSVCAHSPPQALSMHTHSASTARHTSPHLC